MKTSKSEYSKMVDKASPNSPKIMNCVKAFLFGGLICTIGQIILTLLQNAGLSAQLHSEILRREVCELLRQMLQLPDTV